jgi:hypothetical protein
MTPGLWKRTRNKLASYVVRALRADLPPFSTPARTALADLAFQWEARQSKILAWHKKEGVPMTTRNDGKIEAIQTCIQELGTTVHMLQPRDTDGKPTDIPIGLGPTKPACPKCGTDARIGRWQCHKCGEDLRDLWKEKGAA